MITPEQACEESGIKAQADILERVIDDCIKRCVRHGKSETWWAYKNVLPSVISELIARYTLAGWEVTKSFDQREGTPFWSMDSRRIAFFGEGKNALVFKAARGRGKF